MPWLQLKIESTPDTAESLEMLLIKSGANAVTFEDAKDQPVYEPATGTTPLWSETLIIGLFPAKTNMDEVLISLASEISPTPSYKLEILEDQIWERSWLEHFKPMRFGNRLIVAPENHPIETNHESVTLRLDPGLAFGTGTHPTTSLCLQWLNDNDVSGKSVIDYGCGSGILAIAACLLGCKEVIAIDNDPQAIVASNDNRIKNQIPEDQLSCYLVDNKPKNLQSDIIIANILSGPLISLSPLFQSLIKPEGTIVLSGILNEQKQDIITHYSKWMDITSIAENQGWIRVAGNI